MNTYCKLYIDAEMPTKDIVEFVAKIVNGNVSKSSIVSSVLEVDVEENEDFNQEERDSSQDGFLFYRFYLDIEPNSGLFSREYVNAIGALLEGLWAAGLPAIASCEFEDELPRKGGFNYLNR